MTATTGRAGRREWIGLAVLLLPTLVLAMDMGVLFFAAPTTLAPSGTQQLWIMDMYSFLLAGLLITMGSPPLPPAPTGAGGPHDGCRPP